MYHVPKKVPEYRYPLYRSTGTRFKKVISDMVSGMVFVCAFSPRRVFVCAFSPRNRDHQQKKLTAFTHILKNLAYSCTRGIVVVLNLVAELNLLVLNLKVS